MAPFLHNSEAVFGVAGAVNPAGRQTKKHRKREFPAAVLDSMNISAPDASGEKPFRIKSADGASVLKRAWLFEMAGSSACQAWGACGFCCA
jgi:hypothetical protein